MLLGEHLGRRHQGTLVTALHGDQQRRDGDDGLAGTDVALQQPVHRLWDREVGLDLLDRSTLGTCQRIRQCLVEPANELTAEGVRQTS